MGRMEELRAEVHQVNGKFVHLVSETIDGADSCLGMIEGAGICLANSLSSMSDVDRWLKGIFGELFPGHRCDLGCIRLPNAEFIADEEVLERLAGVSDVRPS